MPAYTNSSLAALAIFLGGAAICSADLATGGSALGSAGGSIFSCGATGSSPTVGTSNAACSFSGVATAGGFTNTLSGDVLATATYGGRVFASIDERASSTAGPVLPSLRGSATASFIDTLTVSGRSGDGYISYSFGGFITSITDTGSNSFMFQQENLAPESVSKGRVNFSGPVHYQTALYRFTFGIPFTVSVSANAFAIGEPGDAFIAGLVDMSLNNIAVVDLNGSSLSYTITSQSGAMYPTPEPSSILLLGTFVVLTSALIRKRLRSLTRVA